MLVVDMSIVGDFQFRYVKKKYTLLMMALMLLDDNEPCKLRETLSMYSGIQCSLLIQLPIFVMLFLTYQTAGQPHRTSKRLLIAQLRVHQKEFCFIAQG